MFDFVTEIKLFLQLLNNWMKFSISFMMNLPLLFTSIYVNTIGVLYRALFVQQESSLLNEVVLLVGAGKSPVGIQLASKLSETNAKVVLLDKGLDTTYESIVRKIKESGEMAFFYDCDVTDKQAVRSAIDAIERDVGRVTMLFHGSLLMDQLSDSELMYSYVHLVDALLPRMQATKKGQMVFLSLVNGSSDYSHLRFVQGLFDSILPNIRSLRVKDRKINLTQVNVHKKLLTDYSRDYLKFSIFGAEEVSSVAKNIIKGVRQKKLVVSMPMYMSSVPKYLNILPKRVSDKLVDMMYRIY